MSKRLKGLVEKHNEFKPLVITIIITIIVGFIYQYSPDLLSRMDSNPFVPYYNASEFHDIIRRALKVFAFTGIDISIMMMLFPGAWARLESMMRSNDYEPKWVRDLFIFLSFSLLLLALVLV